LKRSLSPTAKPYAAAHADDVAVQALFASVVESVPTSAAKLRPSAIVPSKSAVSFRYVRRAKLEKPSERGGRGGRAVSLRRIAPGWSLSRGSWSGPTLRAVLLRLIVILLALLGAQCATGAMPSVSSGQVAPACDDQVDNDGDGNIDWFEDPTCSGNPEGATEGTPAVCSDRLDNDGDGAIDGDDPGCRGRVSGTTEADPAPVASSFEFTRLRVDGCGIETAVEVLPDLSPKELFPFGDVKVTVRGVSGRARGIHRTRQLPLAPDAGYGFENLRAGRYEASGSYPGDPFRLASETVRRRITIPASRCRVYFSGSGYRRYQPRIVYFGASQRIYGIVWRRWGGPVASGTGIYPVNDCVPYCTAGSIVDYPVSVRLSRRRLCNGYVQYLTMRRTYRGRRPTGSPPSQTVNFGYRCR
jgi:hypothetical protein